MGEGGECFVDVADLPLLASEEGVADDAVSVDRVESGALAEGAQPRFDLVGAVDREVWVGDACIGSVQRRRSAKGSACAAAYAPVWSRLPGASASNSIPLPRISSYRSRNCARCRRQNGQPKERMKTRMTWSRSR